MTNPAPTLAGAPTVEELTAVTDPIERARRITLVARAAGTLPRALAALRDAAVAEARGTTNTVATLAAQIGLSPARISQITSRTTRTEATR